MKFLKKNHILEAKKISSEKEAEAKVYVMSTLRKAVESDNKHLIDQIFAKYDRFIEYEELFSGVCQNKYKDIADFLLDKFYGTTDILELLSTFCDEGDQRKIKFIAPYLNNFIEKKDYIKLYNIVDGSKSKGISRYRFLYSMPIYSKASSYKYKIERKSKQESHKEIVSREEEANRENKEWENDPAPNALMQHLIDNGDWSDGDPEEVERLNGELITKKEEIQVLKDKIIPMSVKQSTLMQKKIELETSSDGGGGDNDNNEEKINSLDEITSKLDDDISDLKTELEDLLYEQEELESELESEEGDDVYHLHEIEGPGYDIRQFEYGNFDSKDYHTRSAWIVGTEDETLSLALEMAKDMVEGDASSFAYGQYIDAEKVVDYYGDDSDHFREMINDEPGTYLEDDDKEITGGGENILKKYKTLLTKWESDNDNVYDDEEKLAQALYELKEDNDIDELVNILNEWKDKIDEFEIEFFIENKIFDQEEIETVIHYLDKIRRYQKAISEKEVAQQKMFDYVSGLAHKHIAMIQKLKEDPNLEKEADRIGIEIDSYDEKNNKLEEELNTLNTDLVEEKDSLWSDITEDFYDKLDNDINFIEDDDEMFGWCDTAIENKVEEYNDDLISRINSDPKGYLEEMGVTDFEEYLDIDQIATDWVDEHKASVLSRDDVEGYENGFYIYKHND